MAPSAFSVYVRTPASARLTRTAAPMEPLVALLPVAAALVGALAGAAVTVLVLRPAHAARLAFVGQ